VAVLFRLNFMFDNTSANSATPPSNLPTGTDISSQLNVDKTENTDKPKDQPKTTASPIRHDGQIEDIFANTDQASNQSNSGVFKVSRATQPGGGNSSGQSSSGSASPNRGESLYTPGSATSAASAGGLASAGLRQDGSSGQSRSTHFLSSAGLKPKTDSDFGAGNSTPDKIEFEDDKPQRKKYFIIGLIGLLVVGGGAFAYWLLVLNKPLELNSSSNINTSTRTPVNTQGSAPVTQPSPEPATVPVTPTPAPQAPVEEMNPELSDLDQDGLSDIEEAELKTNPRKADTDGDSLFDREEVKVYLTDPLDPDTDGDGYLDGEEVENGFNPKGEGKLLPDIN
jgi:cell division septation protein DedD